MQPGVSVAQLARENNINDNLLFNWRRLYWQELLTPRVDTPAIMPVMLTTEAYNIFSGPDYESNLAISSTLYKATLFFSYTIYI